MNLVLKKIIPQIIRINHIGSTAVSSIWAKPIIDILVEVPKVFDLVRIKDLLFNNGYNWWKSLGQSWGVRAASFIV